MKYYTAFGLTIASAIDLPEPIPLATVPPAVDVTIEIGPVPEHLANAFRPGAWAEGTAHEVLLRSPHSGRFLVANGRTIVADVDSTMEAAGVRLFVLGPCMGALLQQRGDIVLHGHALSWDGQTSEICVGHSGAGKSTWAAWQVQQGAWLVADDLCAVRLDAAGVPWVMPSYPQLKLWQASADLLAMDTRGWPRVRSDMDKFAWRVADRFLQHPTRLTKVRELSATRSEEELDVVSGTAKIEQLLAHTHYRYFLRHQQRIGPYTRQLTQLAALIGMQRVARPAIVGKAIW